MPRTGPHALGDVVRDRRNILLLRPMQEDAPADDFLKTLAHALRRAIQLVYQVEEQEVSVETIGREPHRRILLWEAAEGGIGVWERLVEAPASFGELAREALRLCHFHLETGEPDPAWSERCTAACYDCLLSYSNQPDHRLLNRFLLREYLLRLATAKAAPEAGRRSYDEQYRWLLERTDPASSFDLFVRADFGDSALN
jgi:hypothetical protein